MIEKREIVEYFRTNYKVIKDLSSKFIQFNEEVERKFSEIYQLIDLRELEESLKKKFRKEIRIEKAEIEFHDGSIFWINVVLETSIILFEIYVNDPDIYCYPSSENKSFQEIIDKIDKHLDIEINEETKVAAYEIENFVEEITVNVSTNINF